MKLQYMRSSDFYQFYTKQFSLAILCGNSVLFTFVGIIEIFHLSNRKNSAQEDSWLQILENKKNWNIDITQQ